MDVAESITLYGNDRIVMLRDFLNSLNLGDKGVAP